MQMQREREALVLCFSVCASTAEVGRPVPSWEEHPPPVFANRFTEASQPTPLSAQGRDCSREGTAMVKPAPSRQGDQ